MKVLLSLVLAIASLFSDTKFDLGEKIYKDTCVSCHGLHGDAKSEMQLVVKPRNLQKSILTQEQSYEIIKNGAHFWGANADIMPAFKSVYNDKELHAIAYYIKKRFNPFSKETIENLYIQSDLIQAQEHDKMMKRGAKVYKRNCSWCHGLDAKGDGEATHNPEKSIYPYDLKKMLLNHKQIFLYVKYGGKFWGTAKDDMPSWKVKYDDYTLQSVVVYVEETFRKEH